MELTPRELWTALHGMVLGGGCLLLFSGLFIAVWNLATPGLTDDGINRQLRRLAPFAWVMTLSVWGAVVVGTYWVYPWYRARPPTGAPIAAYPKFLLLADPKTKRWHEFGMEWKEHVAWLAPMLVTAVLFVLIRHGRVVARDATLRRVVLVLLTTAFFCVSIAGILGALINKAAPTR